MADLEGRFDDEAKLKALLLAIILFDEPMAARSPFWFLQRIRESAVPETIRSIVERSSAGMLNEIDFEIREREANKLLRSRLERQVEQYQIELAARLSARHAQWIEDQEAKQAEARQQPESRILPAPLPVIDREEDEGFYRDSDADREAVTSTTAAISQAELITAAFVRGYFGVKLAAKWYTEMDGRVCKVCRPLHGKREDVWMQQFRQGPPAHPNCRCFIQWFKFANVN